MAQRKERTCLVITKFGRFQIKCYGFGFNGSLLVLTDADSNNLAIFSAAELVGIIDQDALASCPDDLDAAIDAGLATGSAGSPPTHAK
jgi:hypothetical protein